MLNVKLVVVGGDAKAAEVRLKLPTVIGRGREANLTVPHALVSRRHTEIFEKDGKLFVRDLGSLNGTFVNNTKIEGDQPLEPNQLLTLGNITFRALYESPVMETEETVTFDEVSTEEIERSGRESVKDDFPGFDGETRPTEPHRESAAALNFDSAKNLESHESEATPTGESFVDFESVDGESDDDASKNTPEQVEASGTEPENVEPESVEESVNSVVLNSEDDLESDAQDTDKSLLGSSVFSFDEESKPAKSVSASAIEGLPDGPAPAVSFVGKVNFGDDAGNNPQVDSVRIDLGQEPKNTDDSMDDDSSLGSFLKKLPQ